MINLFVNDKPYNTQESNLALFLQEIGIQETAQMAVAVNDAIISKKNLAVHVLKSNDKITLIGVTCGG